MLKAALNHAYDEGHVANRDAWGRRLAPFEKVEVARALSDSRRGGASVECVRERLPPAGARRAGNRMQVWRTNPAGGLRLQPRRRHADDPAVQVRQAAPRGADGGGYRFLPAPLCGPQRV